MHPQTPEKPTNSFINNFLKYPQNTGDMRQEFLLPKTVDQIKQTPKKNIEMEFKLLSYADIDDHVFNLQFLKQNRYTDIFAYEHSRVKIPEVENYYINGNQVKSLVDNQPYAIFSQAPFQQYSSFWEGVYYKNVSKVIMLCKFYDPNRGHQSEQYWPSQGQSASFSNGKLRVTNVSSKNLDDEFTETTFKIEGPKGQKNILHYHWIGWSDLKRPLEGNIDKFQFLINVCQEQIDNKRLIWIHCSAGIGRTGTLGGVVDGIRYLKLHNKMSIFSLVENMRKYRYHAVQTFDQYNFLYSYFARQKP